MTCHNKMAQQNSVYEQLLGDYEPAVFQVFDRFQNKPIIKKS